MICIGTKKEVTGRRVYLLDRETNQPYKFETMEEAQEFLETINPIDRQHLEVFESYLWVAENGNKKSIHEEA